MRNEAKSKRSKPRGRTPASLVAAAIEGAKAVGSATVRFADGSSVTLTATENGGIKTESAAAASEREDA